MIQAGTTLNIADNTGARKIQCFKVLGGTRRRYAKVGDIIVASVKEAEPRREVKKGDKIRAVIVRQKKALARSDGSYIRFDDNAAAIVEGFEPKGNRNLVLNLERVAVSAVDIVISIEFQCPAKLPGHPLGIAGKGAIVAVAAGVKRGRSGAFIELPVGGKVRIRRPSRGRQNQAQHKATGCQNHQSFTHNRPP